MDPNSAPSRYGVPPKVAVIAIALFWAFYYVTVTLRSWIFDDDFFDSLDNRFYVILFGMGYSYLVYLFLRRLDHKPLNTRVTAAILAACVASIAHGATNYLAFYVFDPTPTAMVGRHPDKTFLASMAESSLRWFFFNACWAAFYLALSYAAQVRDSEREAARLRAAAQSAELRALRYQVNPHFLFNTLNALSSLVLSDRRSEAEAMILNLSTFFRTSLSADPAEDQPLADEVSLQQLYLQIESVRFPDRLNCSFAIDPAAADACVPGMILQPLIENAVKYAVAPARRAVTIAVRAAADGDRLRITVEDDGDSPPEAPGTGVGLRNVRDRLAARHGGAATMEAGPRPQGGFAVTLTLPLVKHVC
jgi:two-component system LytT family sensor kinase